MSKTGLRYSLSIIITTVCLLAGCAGGGKSLTGDNDAPISSAQSNEQKRAAIHLQLAVGYYQRHEMTSALDEIKQALQADSDFADAYSMRGLIYMEMGETRLADENFQHALKLAPNNSDFSNNYGWFLCQNGRPADSIPYFEAALKNRNYTSPGKALDNAGMCSLKLNDAVAAEKYFKRAFNAEPGNLRVNQNLAKIYYEKGDYDNAGFYINRVVKADVVNADVLWLAIKVAHKTGDRVTEDTLGAKLQRYQPNSVEYAAYQRGAFNE